MRWERCDYYEWIHSSRKFIILYVRNNDKKESGKNYVVRQNVIILLKTCGDK